MEIKKILLGTLAATIAIMAVDSLYFMVIMKDFLAEHGPKYDNEIPGLHVLGELFAAFLIALLYPKVPLNGTPLVKGLTFGFIMGLITMGSSAMHMIAEMGGAVTFPLSLLALSILSSGAAGIPVAYIYEKKKS